MKKLLMVCAMFLSFICTSATLAQDVYIGGVYIDGRPLYGPGIESEVTIDNSLGLEENWLTDENFYDISPPDLPSNISNFEPSLDVVRASSLNKLGGSSMECAHYRWNSPQDLTIEKRATLNKITLLDRRHAAVWYSGLVIIKTSYEGENCQAVLPYENWAVAVTQRNMLRDYFND